MKKFFTHTLMMLTVAVMLTAGCMGGAGNDDHKASKKEAERVLHVGIYAQSAPFTFQDVNAKDYIGFDIDLMEAIAKEMGVTVKYNNMFFKKLLPALGDGNIDIAISAISVNEERKTRAEFSDSYLHSGLILIVREDERDLTGVKALVGKKIGVQDNTTGEFFARGIEKAKIVEHARAQDMIEALKRGSIDAVIVDRPLFYYYRNRHAINGIKVLPDMLTKEDYGIAVKKGNTKLVEEINTALRTLKKNGGYDKVYQKWFGIGTITNTAPNKEAAKN